MAVRIDVAGRLPHRVPGMIVGDDRERRQLFGAGHIVIGERIAEVIGAVTDRRDHFAFGSSELSPKAAAKPKAETSGEARSAIAARGGYVQCAARKPQPLHDDRVLRLASFPAVSEVERVDRCLVLYM